jgi:hypothetical protein
MSNNDAYEAVLQDLRAQREKIDTAISAIEALRPQPTTNDVSIKVGSSPEEVLTPSTGKFAGKTIAEAAEQVLSEAGGGPLHVSKIVDAITSQGVVITSADASNTVGSVLNRRAKEKGKLRRIGRGTWVLEDIPFSFGGGAAEAEDQRETREQEEAMESFGTPPYGATTGSTEF